jgi:tetratricopeptide (TPR) repeat protein
MVATLNNLAAISFKRGDYTKALEEFLKILDIDIHTLPLHHLSLANTYHNIAYVQMELKNYPQVLENETVAFNIAMKSNHPDMNIYIKK